MEAVVFYSLDLKGDSYCIFRNVVSIFVDKDLGHIERIIDSRSIAEFNQYTDFLDFQDILKSNKLICLPNKWNFQMLFHARFGSDKIEK